MNLKHITKDLGKFVTKESPQILTILGIAGAGVTVYLTGKATWKAAQQIQHEEIVGKVENDDQSFQLNNKARFEKVWKLYIPAAATGVMAVGCIVAANRVQARRYAALAAAYGLLSGDFDEFRDKAAEQLGFKKMDEIDNSIARDKIDREFIPPGAVTNEGLSWFKDNSSGRYFLSTQESVKKAMNFVNFEANNQRGASLNTFYDELGLDPTGVGHILGWAAGEALDIVFSPVLLDNGMAVTEIKFRQQPKPGF